MVYWPCTVSPQGNNNTGAAFCGAQQKENLYEKAVSARHPGRGHPGHGSGSTLRCTDRCPGLFALIGYIPLGFTKATTIHIPVIIGSILLGPQKGAVLGGVFGLTSLINNTLYPTATSFVFSPFYSAGAFKGGWASLIICFAPRILVGVTPWLVWHLLEPRLGSSRTGRLFSLGLAGFAGALTNTLLVMNGIFSVLRRCLGRRPGQGRPVCLRADPGGHRDQRRARGAGCRCAYRLCGKRAAAGRGKRPGQTIRRNTP